MDLKILQDVVLEFARERDWEQFHDPKNLSMALASEVGELNALLRWIRNEDVPAALAVAGKRDALREEVGDIGILILLLCAHSNGHFDEAVLAKLKKNSLKYPVRESKGRPDPPTSSLRISD